MAKPLFIIFLAMMVVTVSPCFGVKIGPPAPQASDKGTNDASINQPPSIETTRDAYGNPLIETLGFHTGNACTTTACQQSPILILSVDGAAVRGLAQLRVLQAIEGKVRELLMHSPYIPQDVRDAFSKNPPRITDMFDVFAGTSAGAINVTALVTPKNVPNRETSGLLGIPDGTLMEARYRLLQSGKAIDVNKEKVNGPEGLDALRDSGQLDLVSIAHLMINSIFKKSPKKAMRDIRVLWGISGARFDHQPLENLLQGLTTMMVVDHETLGGLNQSSKKTKQKSAKASGMRLYYNMSDTVKPVVLTSWDENHRSLFLFSTFDACQHPNDQPNARNRTMWFAARTASAGPTYFNPTQVQEMVNGQIITRTLIDAGLIVMSPALLGLVEAMRIYPDRRYLIVSISGGVVQKPRNIKAKGIHSSGLLKSLKPALEGAVEGGPLVAERVLSMLPNVQYMRINIDVDNTRFADAGKKNMAHIQNAALETIVGKLKVVVNSMVSALVERQQKKDVEPYRKCMFPKGAMTDKRVAEQKMRSNVWGLTISNIEDKASGKNASKQTKFEERMYTDGRPASISVETIEGVADIKKKPRKRKAAPRT